MGRSLEAPPSRIERRTFVHGSGCRGGEAYLQIPCSMGVTGECEGSFPCGDATAKSVLVGSRGQERPQVDGCRESEVSRE